ncbi:hypothetical protein D3C84_1226790 [compost metagenome]
MEDVLNAGKIERVAGHIPEQQQNSQQQAGVANASNDERFLRCCLRLRLVIPEADEQERAYADELPEQIQHQHVVRQDKS